MKFRRKPTIVEARQFDGTNCIELLRWMRVPDYTNPEIHSTDHPVVHTPNGDVSTEVGDWIIEGTHGEFYPCRSDIFEANYEPAEEKTCW